MQDTQKSPKKIRHHLKHFFIPHIHNDYKPHVFREVSVAITLATSLFLFGLSAGSAYIMQGTEIGKNIISKVLIDMTNENRLANNLSTLKDNTKLYNAALLKAKDMLDGQYFAHESPTGLTPWHFLEEVKYEYTYAGENLAINHSDNNQTSLAWMNSPLHRKNILDSNFEEIGISAYSGDYSGRNTIFVVQMFGSPAEAFVETEEEKEIKKDVLAKIPEEKLATNTIQAITVLEKDTSFKKIDTEIKDEKKIKVLGENNINYSKVYERLIYSGSNYTQNMLQILFIIIFISAALMICIEIKRQHTKHIAYAVLLLLILIIMMYLNVNYLELNFVSR